MEGKLREFSGHLKFNDTIHIVQLADLQVLEEIGIGLDTIVHLCKWSDHEMAVKTISVNFDQTALRIHTDLEKMRRSRDFPHVAKFYGYFVTERELKICMELMTSFEKLKEKSDDTIPEQILSKMGEGVVKALHYFKTEHNLTQLNIKPTNIFLDNDGVVKISDFCLSPFVSHPARAAEQWCCVYMGPEQFNTKGVIVGTRGNVWTLGVVLVELATGKFPYWREEEMSGLFDMISSIINDEPPRLEEDIALNAPNSFSEEEEEEVPKNFETSSEEELIAAVLVFCATRPDALRNHLSQILAQRPSHYQYHIVISQDGNKTAVTEVAERFVREFRNVTHIQHEKLEAKKRNNYPAISAHYKWALDKVFNEFRYDHVIVTEDDLDIGNDFFSYFRWGKQVLNADDTIWCVSAWNDNGGGALIDLKRGGDRVWRTDFFPGLGWMLTKKLWSELSPGFPAAYWDDWMRKPEVRKNRSCVRPEISRTSHNMKLAGKGSSGGMYKDYLSRISASQFNIDFSLLPTSLVQKTTYDQRLIEDIENARPLHLENATSMLKAYNYKIVYKNIRDWHKLAAHFKLMTDIRGGMQRTAYYGVVTVMSKGCRVFLVPEPTYQSPQALTQYVYDPNWDKQNRFIEFETYYCKTKKYPGKCDPHDPEMIAFFKRKGWRKRLEDWGEMIVV